MLKGFKGVKPDKIKQIIEDDHNERILEEKRLKGKDGGDEFEANAKAEIKKRKFINTIRPPDYWNFFEDGAEELKVKHVLRYNAKPTECY